MVAHDLALVRTLAPLASISQRQVTTLALLIGTFFFVSTSALAVARHQAFATGNRDLQIYTQVEWSLANGMPFSTTLLRTNTLHLAEHLGLDLLPIAPLYGLNADPRLLLVLQQAALSVTLLTVGCFARGRLGPFAGLILLGSFALHPVLGEIGLDDFHAVVFAAFPIALGLVLAVCGLKRSAALLLLFAAVMEEEAGLVVIGLGLLFLARRSRIMGLRLVGGGTLLLGLCAFAIMPQFHDPRTFRADPRSSRQFKVIQSQPDVLLDRLFVRRGPLAVQAFVLPSGGLALLSPSVLAASLPTFAVNFLRDRENTLTHHWTAPVLPAVWLATVCGLTALAGRWRRWGVALVALGASTAYAMVSPLPGGYIFDPAEFVRGAREQALERAVALVPADAPATVSQNVAPHLANRRELYIYPIDDTYADALRYQDRAMSAYLLDLTDPPTQRVPPLGRASPLAANPPYIVQSTAHKILVLTRSAEPPEHPLDLLFGKGLAFHGYDLARVGDLARITFHWERVAGISADFRRIVELIDGSGRVLATDDELELTRTLPTQKWQVGQQVRDEVELTIPPGSSSGLRARVQWQNRDQRRPITLQDDSTSVELSI